MLFILNQDKKINKENAPEIYSREQSYILKRASGNEIRRNKKQRI